MESHFQCSQIRECSGKKRIANTSKSSLQMRFRKSNIVDDQYKNE